MVMPHHIHLYHLYETGDFHRCHQSLKCVSYASHHCYSTLILNICHIKWRPHTGSHQRDFYSPQPQSQTHSQSLTLFQCQLHTYKILQLHIAELWLSFWQNLSTDTQTNTWRSTKKCLCGGFCNIVLTTTFCHSDTHTHTRRRTHKDR